MDGLRPQGAVPPLRRERVSSRPVRRADVPVDEWPEWCDVPIEDLNLDAFDDEGQIHLLPAGRRGRH
jgi:hypothetical protein